MNAPSDPSQPDRRIFPILVERVYRQAHIGIVGTLVNASILVFILWNEVDRRALTAWFSVLVTASLCRLASCAAFRRAPEGRQNTERWSRVLYLGLGFSGVLWGSTAILLFPAHSIAHQVVIALVLAGMVAGAVGVFSPLLPSFFIFSIPALTPLFVRFLLIGGQLHMTLAAMTLLFAILTFSTAKNINRSTRELVHLKETFADRLEDRTAELKRVNEKLKQEVEDRRKAQKALADSEQRLSDIIEFLPDPTWVIDTQSRVIAWNRAVEKLTGVPKKAIVGRGRYAYAVPFYGKARPMLIDLALRRDARWEKDYLRLGEEDGVLISGESFHPAMGKEGRYFAGTASRLYDSLGNVVGAIESIRDVTVAKQAEQDRERLIAELQEAIAKIRTLSGLLPICSSCKKIRDDKGYWTQIENYITDHSMAEFSHGICPDCAKRLYPNLDLFAD